MNIGVFDGLLAPRAYAGTVISKVHKGDFYIFFTKRTIKAHVRWKYSIFHWEIPPITLSLIQL